MRRENIRTVTLIADFFRRLLGLKPKIYSGHEVLTILQDLSDDEIKEMSTFLRKAIEDTIMGLPVREHGERMKTLDHWHSQLCAFPTSARIVVHALHEYSELVEDGLAPSLSQCGSTAGFK